MTLAISWLALMPLTALRAETTQLQIATFELPPYVGSQLDEMGATSEIVAKALQQIDRAGQLSFSKAARAKELALQAKLDAVFPIVYDDKLAEQFIFSAPLPGIRLSLLRKKSNTVLTPNDLAGKSIGVVRGAIPSSITQRFGGAIFHNKANNQALLKMLMADRLDFVLIDQFTAADLMVDHFPEMIGALEFVESTALSVDFHIAFSRKVAGAEELAAKFNQSLKKLIISGEMKQILYRHGLYIFSSSNNKRVLRIATVANPDMLMMQQLANLYEYTHLGLTIEWHVLEENILRRRLLSDLAIGKGQYDVMTIGAYEAEIWAQRGWLMPIDNLPEDYDLRDLIDPVRQSLTHNGKMTALPFYGETSVTYYRTDLFAKAGLTMPDHPSYDDILHYARTLHVPANDIYGICLRGKPGWGENIALISTMVSAYGGQWFDTNWQPMLETKPWQQAVARYTELTQNYGPPQPHNKGYKQNLQLFADGHCAMWIDATVAASTLYSPTLSSVSDDVAIVAAPKAVTSKGSSWLWTWSLAIPNSSKFKPQALEFITWATSKQYTELVAKTLGWISVPPGTRKSTYASPDYQAAAPFAAYVFEHLRQATPMNTSPPPSPYTGNQFYAVEEFPAIGTQVGLQVCQVLLGEKTIEQALQASQRFVQAKMRLANYQQEE